MDFFQQLSKSEIITGIAALIAALLGLAGALEKLFGWKSVGTLFCSLLWKICLAVWNWARGAQLKQISIQLDIIRREVTPNGGGSMKDVLNFLKNKDETNWQVIMGLHDFTKELSIRMDIADEADNRMSFKLGDNKSCVFISENFLRYFGYTDRDMLGSNWDFCIDEKHLRTVRTKWKDAFATRKPYRNEQIIIGSDSSRHLCLVRGFPIENRDGELTGYFGSVEVLESLDE